MHCPPINQFGMIHTREDLEVFIRRTLEDCDRCRVFCDTLHFCWNMPNPELAEAIAQFAKKHEWRVKVHEPGAYGVVADFGPRRSLEPISVASHTGSHNNYSRL